MKITPTLEECKSVLDDAVTKIHAIAVGKNPENLKENLLQIANAISDVAYKIDSVSNMAYIGQKFGGQSKSAAKVSAVRENGKKGGRPSKKSIINIEEIKNDDGSSSCKIDFSDGSQKIINGDKNDAERIFPSSRYKRFFENTQKFE